jgi:hypothetical protein
MELVSVEWLVGVNLMPTTVVDEYPSIERIYDCPFNNLARKGPVSHRLFKRLH